MQADADLLWVGSHFRKDQGAFDDRADARNPSAGLFGPKALRIAAIGLGTAATQLDTAVNIAFPAITQRFYLAIGDITSRERGYHARSTMGSHAGRSGICQT